MRSFGSMVSHILGITLLAVSAVHTHALHIGATTTPRSSSRSTSEIRCQASPQIAKPKTVTKQKTSGPGGGGGKGGGGAAQIAKPKRKAHVEDIPMWKVILLSDEEYVEDLVCTVLKSIIPGIENDRQAAERYQEAMKSGRSLLITQPKEQAEFYVEQLARCDPDMIVFSTIEEE